MIDWTRINNRTPEEKAADRQAIADQYANQEAEILSEIKAWTRL